VIEGGSLLLSLRRESECEGRKQFHRLSNGASWGVNGGRKRKKTRVRRMRRVRRPRRERGDRGWRGLGSGAFARDTNHLQDSKRKA